MKDAGDKPPNKPSAAFTSMAGFWRSATGAPVCDDFRMQISAPCVVSLTWKLNDGQNRPIDVLADPVEFFYGGDDLLGKVEEALEGHTAGAELQLHLEPEHAFGDYKAELVCFEKRTLFPAALETGMAFEGLPAGAATPDMPAEAIYVVTEIYPDHVVLDGNHPLAGMSLRLAMKVEDVREATPAEIEDRSVSGSALGVLGSGRPAPDPTLH
jgi:FKBP-type peptidyl-prolyl cis-trans isomerase SlyD